MDELNKLRVEVDNLDKELIEILADRFRLIRKIGEIKRKKGIGIDQPEREEEILQKLLKLAERNGISKDFTESILKKLFEESKKTQCL